MKFTWMTLLVSSLTLADIGPFTLAQMNLGGGTYQSESRPNAVFVLENYFNRCPYCHKNAPNVAALAEEYRNNPYVQVLDIGIDTRKSEYDLWISETQPNHPVLNDGARALTSQLETRLYPSTYVVDCHGAIQFSSRGVWDSDTTQAIRDAIDKSFTVSRCGS